MTKKVICILLSLILFCFPIFTFADEEDTSEKDAYKQDTAYYEPNILTKLRYPLSREAKITSGFGAREPIKISEGTYTGNTHTGVDFGISMGTPVLAAESGEVIYAGWRGSYGNLIEIRHSTGMTTRYGHLSEINVKVGEAVIRGQMIGKVGSTGFSTGPHLHFEVLPDGRNAVNPLPYLSEPNEDNSLYCNVKFLFLKQGYSLPSNTNKIIKLDADDIISEDEISNKEQLYSEQDILFQLNELYDVKYEDDNTVIDISDIYTQGLVNSEPIFIQSKYNVQFKENKLIIEGKIEQSEIQLAFNSKELNQKNIVTIINSEYETISSDIYTFNPLFPMSFNLNINDITKENIIVKVDGNTLNTNYYTYENGKLNINYSCLYINELQIDITQEKKILDEQIYVKPLNRITTWIEADDIDILGLNSFIKCYVTNSIDNNSISDYYLSPYNKYNFKVANGVISSVLIDEKLSDIYISLPIQPEYNIDTETDPNLYNGYRPISKITFNNTEYGPLIYGETLDISRDISIEEGIYNINFKIIDYKEIDNQVYIIVFYNIDNLGGYFGIKLTNTN